MRNKWERYPRFVPAPPSWWADFEAKLAAGQIWAKGDKGDSGSPGQGIVSNPPAGCKKVTNIYVNQNGKLVVEYDDAGGN
jgi:hypothetical protein